MFQHLHKCAVHYLFFCQLHSDWLSAHQCTYTRASWRYSHWQSMEAHFYRYLSVMFAAVNQDIFVFLLMQVTRLLFVFSPCRLCIGSLFFLRVRIMRVFFVFFFRAPVMLFLLFFFLWRLCGCFFVFVGWRACVCLFFFGVSALCSGLFFLED